MSFTPATAVAVTLQGISVIAVDSGGGFNCAIISGSVTGVPPLSALNCANVAGSVTGLSPVG